MVESMNSAHPCAVNDPSATRTSAPSSPDDGSRNVGPSLFSSNVKAGRAGTIPALVLVADTPGGTVLTATRAPNTTCRQLHVIHGAASLSGVVMPVRGRIDACAMVRDARRLLRVRLPADQPIPVPPAAVLRALWIVRTVAVWRAQKDGFMRRMRNLTRRSARGLICFGT